MTHLSKRAPAALAAALALGAAGCDHGLTDLNRNPNQPETAAAEYLFTNAVEAAVGRATGAGLNLDLTGLWVQHYSESRFSEEDKYIVGESPIGGHWTGFYAGPLQDLNEVVAKGEAEGRPNVQAMGMIMRAWTFHVVTDLWGDVGYSEALRLRQDPAAGNFVKYDPQAEIYNGLLSELRTAAGLLTPTGARMGAADLLYRGDPEKWRRFANSLRLRMAMRMSEVAPGPAAAEFADALADGVFTSNADNAVLWYLANGTNEHPIYAYESIPRIDHAISKTLVDSLASLDDPRLPFYAKPTAAGTYQGDVPGNDADVPLNTISRVGEWFARADAPSYVMTYAEVLFLQAEAAERGWITGDAAALYQAAIRAHMTQFNVQGDAFTDIPAAAIDAYLAQSGVAYAGLSSIGLQKWIALYGNGPEAYAEWRRTGYPALLPGPNAANDRLIPRRLRYPVSEQSLNAAALAEATQRQGGAGLNDRVWWDR
ncbi:MAG TPA: SusD/RagB family nutrient-binding outer membrane lipoprotein [Longimicrobium sp.]|nr:SusD/RagB family nutrient-binding outer membrane lipoprotein [Longimicrobium sp.]